MRSCITPLQDQCSLRAAKLGYSQATGQVQSCPTRWRSKMNAIRLNAAFAAVLATLSSFAFAMLNMPAATHVFLGVAA